MNKDEFNREIEFNYIMQMLNEIRIDGAKAKGYAFSFFTLSISAVFFALTINVENFQYEIFSYLYFIIGILVMVLTRVIVKNMKRKFYDIMNGIENIKLK